MWLSWSRRQSVTLSPTAAASKCSGWPAPRIQPAGSSKRRHGESGNFQTEFDRSRRLADLENPWQHDSRPSLTRPFFARDLQQSQPESAVHRLCEKVAGHQHVLANPLRRKPANHGSITEQDNILLRYAFRKVTVSNLNIPADEIPLFYQPTLVSEFSAVLVSRYRETTRPMQQGVLRQRGFGMAATAIGTSASFMPAFSPELRVSQDLARNWNIAGPSGWEFFNHTQTLSH